MLCLILADSSQSKQTIQTCDVSYWQSLAIQNIGFIHVMLWIFSLKI
jgi:hypothetical protein